MKMSVEIFDKSKLSSTAKVKKSRPEIKSKLLVQKKSPMEMIASKKQALQKKADFALTPKKHDYYKRKMAIQKSSPRKKDQDLILNLNQYQDYDISLQVKKQTSRTPRIGPTQNDAHMIE